MPQDRLLAVANGVDPDRFDITETRSECRSSLGLPVDRPVIGYVGNFSNTMGMEKGIAELMQAHAILLKRPDGRPPFLVCVGGPESCIPTYEQIAADMGIGREHFRFPGYADRDSVPCWLKACDILTIPWPQNEWAAYQTSPIKLFEYMASGSPIVASDLPSIREVLTPGENALLSPPGDSTSLAASIAELLDNPAEARRLAAAARQDVGKYTWKKRAERILAGLK